VFKIPEGFTFALHVILPRTRSEEASFCNCLLCQVSSKQGNPKQINLNELIKNAIISQTPDILEPMEVNETQTEPDKNLKYCSHCFSLIGKGLSHTCNDTTALNNLKALYEKRPILAQAFAAYVVKQTPSSPNQTRKLSQLHGRQLPVVIGSPKPPLDKITLTKLAEFGNKNWLSQNQMRAFGQFLGENKVKIEADLQQELVRRNHILDEYYEVKAVDFLIDGQLVRKKIVVCKNASDLVMKVFELRNQIMQDYIVKVYFDNGQKYLKLTCSLIPKKGWKKVKGKKNGRNWNGANTVIILGIAHGVPENNYNSGVFYTNTKFHTIKGMKSLDHKMKHIDTGLQSCSSSYPCLNCLVFHANLGTCGPVRTIADLANNYESFMNMADGNEKLGKLFFNQVNRPWLYATLLEHKLSQENISDVIVPSALHDILGIMNHTFHEVGNLWPELMEDWVKHAKVSKEGYWRGHFLGNAIRDLLEDIAFLEDEYGYAKEPLMAPYIKMMRSFDAVREGVMGMELDPDYAQLITQFKTDYLALEKYGFSVTIKAHDVFFHYIPWLDKWGLPLGLVGEQAGEAVHCRFNKFIEFKQCSNPDSEDFGDNLLQVTVAWSSLAAITFD
jgi:hypothetical protein